MGHAVVGVLCSRWEGKEWRGAGARATGIAIATAPAPGPGGNLVGRGTSVIVVWGVGH